MAPGRSAHPGRPAHRRLVSGIAAALVMTAMPLTGCSDDEAAPSASVQGPLEEYLSVLDLDTAAIASVNAQMNIELQERLAACMTDKGFEYIPQPYTPPDASPPTEPDNEAWVAQYGFGMAGGFDELPFTPPPNPNDAYVATLSETAREAYWDVFAGTVHTSSDADELTVEEQWAGSGCSGEAFLAMDKEDTTDNPYQSPEFTDLTTAMEGLPDAALLEPEMIDLAAQWSSCMADAGLAFASREEMDDAMTLLRNQVPFPHEDGAAEAVAAADEEEIATALADLSCRDDVEWDARATQVRHDLEERFVADHKAELDELVAAVQASRAQ